MPRRHGSAIPRPQIADEGSSDGTKITSTSLWRVGGAKVVGLTATLTVDRAFLNPRCSSPRTYKSRHSALAG